MLVNGKCLCQQKKWFQRHDRDFMQVKTDLGAELNYYLHSRKRSSLHKLFVPVLLFSYLHQPCQPRSKGKGLTIAPRALQPYCDCLYTHTHEGDQRRTFRSSEQPEHPEETTVTSWQINPSQRLHGLITTTANRPLAGWILSTTLMSSPAHHYLICPPKTLPISCHGHNCVHLPQRWSRQCPSVSMVVLLLLTTALLSSRKTSDHSELLGIYSREDS